MREKLDYSQYLHLFTFEIKYLDGKKASDELIGDLLGLGLLETQIIDNNEIIIVVDEFLEYSETIK